MRDYLRPTNLYEEAERRYQELCEICQVLEKRKGKYRKGKIHIVQNKNRVQYYLRNDVKDKTGVYIHKKEQDKIKYYLQKKYDEDVYRILKYEKDNLEHFLKKSNKDKSRIQNIYSLNPIEIKEKLIPIDISDSDYISEWLQETYKGKVINDEVPNFITNRGEHVRSKSELTIANTLAKYDVPYKYEYPFTLSNGRVIFPDFTVLDVKKRRLVYWEHRGMMGMEEYAKNTVLRIKQMNKEGVMLGSNLIITEETLECPLGTDEIENIIKQFLIN